MSGMPALDWALMAVSLLNTVLLVWLGLTVLLNARRRTWAVWLAGGGLLIGGLFFISHSVLLGRGLHTVSPAMNGWWIVGWAAVIISPWLWYVVMLWYAGYWNEPKSTLRRRQRVWFPLTTALSICMAGMLLFVYPLPSYEQVARLDLSAAPSVAGIPVLLLVYPGYILLCIALSLDALLVSTRDSLPGDAMSAGARQRARPWLLASTLLLLLVSLLVAWAMAWIVTNARLRALAGIYETMSLQLAWFDLGIASLIALAVACLGQAIVAYEIFTGETLPRRGFFRHWRNALLLAAGYGVVVGGSLALSLRPIYALLLTAVLMAGLYALSGWRSFAERERYIAHLRPFVSSQRLYDSLLAPSPAAPSPPAPAPPADVDLSALFYALCEDVLEARRAYLVALGPLAAMVGPALAYPGGEAAPEGTLRDLAQASAPRFDSPQTLCAPLDPARSGGLAWAVPLWSERGLIGVLLLGAKRDGGLYTQEEIEIARASGERLIDVCATAQMSTRLMALLRQRIAQVRVLEGQGRRVLHDEILPQLHAAILFLDGLPDAQQAVEALTAAHRRISGLMHDTAPAAPHVLAQQGLLAALRASLESDFAGVFDEVTWRSAPEAERVVASLPAYVVEVLFFAALELIRNAARHGRGSAPQRPLHLEIQLDEAGLTVEDDGVGFGVPPLAAAGHNGLRFHSTMLAAVGGSLEVAGRPGGGTRATVRMPE